MRMIRKIFFYLNFVRCLPHLIVFSVHKNKVLITKDIDRWQSVIKLDYNVIVGLVFLLSNFPEFRNLFYHRVGSLGIFLNLICARLPSLYIKTKSIGPGLFIQHGFATIISAKSIGENCWINQQVTIGFAKGEAPVISDNVTVGSGAQILGNILLGDNVTIGSNAVIVKNVPKNCTVVGLGQVIRKDGVRVNSNLS